MFYKPTGLFPSADIFVPGFRKVLGNVSGLLKREVYGPGSLAVAIGDGARPEKAMTKTTSSRPIPRSRH